MHNSTRKKFQVFVSSTYEDLKQERQAAVEAILTAGHIPAGMELFTSGDQSQMAVIRQWIDESDIFLLILGGRYGSLEPEGGKSYVHLEYEYALSKNKPHFACVFKEKTQNKNPGRPSKHAVELEIPENFKTFREFVITKVVRFWEDYKDIKTIIGETLSMFEKRDNLVGWVRGSSQANMPALADELARLSSENATLREKSTANQETTWIHGLSFEKLKNILKQKKQLRPLLKYKSVLARSNNINEMDGDEYGLDIDELTLRGLIDFKAYPSGSGAAKCGDGVCG